MSYQKIFNVKVILLYIIFKIFFNDYHLIKNFQLT